MRIITKYTELFGKKYNVLTKYEHSKGLDMLVEERLSSISLISMNFPVYDISCFFSGQDFCMKESSTELESSYFLIKYGFFKQSMVSLRIALDLGLLSIYWFISGIDKNQFKDWKNSKSNTPFQNKDFWEIILSNKRIKDYNSEFNIVRDIKNLNLSHYAHTNGIKYSNMRSSITFSGKRNDYIQYNIWYNSFGKVVEVLSALHLLLFPTMNLRYSTKYLLSKYGTFDKIPIVGFGHGDEMNIIQKVIPPKQFNWISTLIMKDNEYVTVKEMIDDLPDLSEDELVVAILETSKNSIDSMGFENWIKIATLIDSRINNEILIELKEWSERNNLLDINISRYKHESEL